MNHLVAGQHRWWRRILAATAVAVLVAISSAVASGPARADGSLPDPTRTATLRIHATATPTDSAGNPDDAVPVAGAEYVIRKLDGIDLTARSGWDAVSALLRAFDSSTNTAAEDSISAAGVGLGAPWHGTTDADGTVVFDALPLGAYLVEQTAAQAGQLPSRPGIVLLPMTDPEALDRWLYTVDLYPKPTTLTIVKAVGDADAFGPGDCVRWTITAAVGVPGDSSVLDAYAITDQRDPRLNVVAVDVGLSDGAPLASGDYVIRGPDADGVLTIEFTESGLSVLTHHTDASVIVTIDTLVHEAGIIPNTALVYANSASRSRALGDRETTLQSNTVQTRWGSTTIAKVDPNGKPLPGAIFSAYRTESDARADRNPIPFQGRTRLAVDDDGLLTLSPLRYSDWTDGHPDEPRDYYLVEVQAPSGYQRLSDPIPFRIDGRTSEPGVDLSISNAPGSARENAPESNPVNSGGLAFTGSQVLPILRIGIVLLGVGGALVLMVRRRRVRRLATAGASPTR